MQHAETVLNVIRECGERGLPLENIYRLLYNRNLYLRAYGRIYSNQGGRTISPLSHHRCALHSSQLAVEGVEGPSSCAFGCCENH